MEQGPSTIVNGHESCIDAAGTCSPGHWWKHTQCDHHCARRVRWVANAQNILSVLVCFGCYSVYQDSAIYRDQKFIYFLTVLESGRPRSRCQQFQCLARGHSLIPRWCLECCPGGHCVFTWQDVEGHKENKLLPSGAS